MKEYIVDDMIESIQHRLDLLGLSATDFTRDWDGITWCGDREKGTVIGATTSTESANQLKKR